MMHHQNAFGDLLRLFRKRLGVTQADLAQQMGMSQRGISDWERRLYLPDDPEKVLKLARLLYLYATETEQLLIAARMQQPSTDAHAEEQKRIVWSVPYHRNPFFTGREELLELLRERMTTLDAVGLLQPQALNGLGGIGKTQTALEYAYRYRKDYQTVCWIRAATYETALTDLIALAETLDLPEKHETDQFRILAAVKQWLATHERWLVILDNADDLAQMRDLLPDASHGHLLLTTRAQALGGLAQPITIETMGIAESTLFLLHRSNVLAQHGLLERASEADLAGAEAITIALDFLPLALDQAGAYIEETSCSLVDYLDLYQTHRQKLLALRGEHVSTYPASVATTWSLSFQKVEQANPAAAELLRLCAFLAPDGIPEELFKEGAAYWPAPLQQAVVDPFGFQQLVAALLKFSLVKRQVGERTLSLHRLVQAVQVDMIEPEGQGQWAERVVQVLDDVFLDANEVSAWPRYLRFLAQAQLCTTHIKQYQLITMEASRLLNQTGMFLVHYAMYSIAESLFEQAIAVSEQLQGPSHPDTASCLNNLAVLFRTQGKYAQAEPLYQRALTIREQALGPDHPKTALSLNNLATFYQTQEKYVEAEPLYERALAICEQQYGPDHPETARCLTNLAGIYRVLLKDAQAEPLFERALAIREHQLGADHPDTAHSLGNLALYYQDQKRFAEAEPLYQRALTIREHVFGPDNPLVAQSLHNLADLYHAQGRYEAALPLYQRGLKIWERTLGPDHPNTVVCQEHLAILLRKMEQSK